MAGNTNGETRMGTNGNCDSGARKLSIGVQDFEKLRREDTPGVYNPFSLLNALDKKQFDAFWFSTGTPTFLLKKLKEAEFDPKKFTDGSIYADEATLSDYRTENPDPVPLLFQSGYLTIKKYDAKYGSYELGYPNNEVKYGFLKSLAPMFLQDEKAV